MGTACEGHHIRPHRSVTPSMTAARRRSGVPPASRRGSGRELERAIPHSRSPARHHVADADESTYRPAVPVRPPEPRAPGAPPIPRPPEVPPLPRAVLLGPGPCGSPGCPGGKSGGNGFTGAGCPGVGPGPGLGPGCGPGRLLVCAREVVSGAAETTNRNTQPARFNAIVRACLSRGWRQQAIPRRCFGAAVGPSRPFMRATTVPRGATRTQARGMAKVGACRRFLFGEPDPAP